MPASRKPPKTVPPQATIGPRPNRPSLPRIHPCLMRARHATVEDVVVVVRCIVEAVKDIVIVVRDIVEAVGDALVLVKDAV
jgi:hypothetical protein